MQNCIVGISPQKRSKVRPLDELASKYLRIGAGLFIRSPTAPTMVLSHGSKTSEEAAMRNEVEKWVMTMKESITRLNMIPQESKRTLATPKVNFGTP